MTDNDDVLVVGAGVARASAAYDLAKLAGVGAIS